MVEHYPEDQTCNVDELCVTNCQLQGLRILEDSNLQMNIFTLWDFVSLRSVLVLPSKFYILSSVLDFATKAFCIFSPADVSAWAIIVRTNSRFLGFVLNSKVTFTEAVKHTQCRSCLFRVLSVSQLCSHEPEPQVVKKPISGCHVLVHYALF